VEATRSRVSKIRSCQEVGGPSLKIKIEADNSSAFSNSTSATAAMTDETVEKKPLSTETIEALAPVSEG
jgi:hypothetical protein